MKDTLIFSYQLNYDEIYEAFFLLSVKWTKKTRTALTILLTVVAVCFLTLFAVNEHKIHYFYLAILDIFFLTYLIYMPALKAQKGAYKVYKRNGIYRVKLTDEGEIFSGNNYIKIIYDTNARSIETSKSYIIRPNEQHTFCIPKRIMSVQDQKRTTSILQSVCKYRIEP